MKRTFEVIAAVIISVVGFFGTIVVIGYLWQNHENEKIHSLEIKKQQAIQAQAKRDECEEERKDYKPIDVDTEIRQLTVGDELKGSWQGSLGGTTNGLGVVAGGFGGGYVNGSSSGGFSGSLIQDKIVSFYQDENGDNNWRYRSLPADSIWFVDDEKDFLRTRIGLDPNCNDVLSYEIHTKL